MTDSTTSDTLSTRDDASQYMSARPRRDAPARRLAFSQVPVPLAGRDRIAWRVPVLLLTLAACRGQSATMEQLHVLSWALRDSNNFEALSRVWSGTSGAPTLLRAWDPQLEDTLSLATASGLVEFTDSGRRLLTTEGKTFVAALRDMDGVALLQVQRQLTALGSITESGMWRKLGTRPASSGIRA